MKFSKDVRDSGRHIQRSLRNHFSTLAEELQETLLESARSAKRAVQDDQTERERRMSTGIGQGVAIPHGKSDLVSGMAVAFGIAAEPVDYDALDGEPVSLFFLLVSPPDRTGDHIKALAQISRLLTSDAVRDELTAAKGADDVLRLLRREEALQDD